MSVTGSARLLTVMFLLGLVCATQLRAQTSTSGGITYIGLTTGPTFPVADSETGYGRGWAITVPFGWRSQVVGVRLDAHYNRLPGKTSAEKNQSVVRNTDLGIVALNADLELNAPRFSPAWLPRFSLLGGLTVARSVADGGATPSPICQCDPTAGPSNNGFATSFSEAPTSLGWNAGANAHFAAGARTNYFVEWRLVEMVTKVPQNLFQGPRFFTITVGIERQLR